MKELSIEEKAKHYDEAIERANELLYVSDKESLQCKTIESIFPELKESEDERIKNFISNELACLRAIDEKGTVRYNELTEAIAWLEKQGEQKSTDKIEPKFKVGDWIITDKKHIWYVDEISKTTLYMYVLINRYGKIMVAEFETVDKKARLWTIKDAEDGDILAAEPINDFPGSFIAIYKERGLDFFNSHCCVSYDGKFYKDITGHDIHHIHPAIKEQSDTLFAKMKEAGYEWDAEKKELKKIDTFCQDNCKGFQETGKCFCDGECKAKKEHNLHRIEQKPTDWQSIRIEAAMRALQSFIVKGQKEFNSEEETNRWCKTIVHNSVIFADSLIEELKKER